jgi:MscS family membrane protein
VEAIGMRSIQLRARDRTVITVPNATFADMEIINWARCDMMLILATIGVRYETRVDQIRYLLARLREVCLAHPKIDNDTIRVRFSGYGASSQDINIRIYALTRDWNEYFAIQEDILLRVADIVEEAGTGFAFPSQTLYLGRDDGIDTETGDMVSGKVAEWRAAGELPFPNMSRAQRQRLADTLDYPPSGSPDRIRSEAVEAEAAEPLSSDEASEAGNKEAEKKPNTT